MTRRRLALALLGFCATWPLVTLWLQARFDVDPWKLMSFGMYAAPGRRAEDLELTLTVERAGRWEPADEGAVPHEAAAYRRWRRTLGRLADAGPLGRALLLHTKAAAARIEVRERRLDVQTARVVVRTETVDVR